LIDDEQHILDTLETLLDYYPDIEVTEKLRDPGKAVDAVSKHKPDLLFLDIHMPQMDGFQLLEAIRPLDINPEVIFITSYDEYAIQAIRYAAFDFLVKPVERGELGNAIERLRNTFQKENAGEESDQTIRQSIAPHKLKFNSCDGIAFFSPEEVLYIEAKKNYSILHLDGNRREHISMNLGRLEEQLPYPPFIRISRSVVINSDYLIKIDKKRRQCILQKDQQMHSFRIPIKRISELNNLL
jgi:two-component system LytT family response regulator